MGWMPEVGQQVRVTTDITSDFRCDGLGIVAYAEKGEMVRVIVVDTTTVTPYTIKVIIEDAPYYPFWVKPSEIAPA